MKLLTLLLAALVALATADQAELNDVVLYGSSGVAVTLTPLTVSLSRAVVSIQDASWSAQSVLSSTTNLSRMSCTNAAPTAAPSGNDAAWGTAVSTSLYWTATGNSLEDGQVRWFCLVQASGDASAYTLTLDRKTGVSVADQSAATLAGLVAQNAYQVVRFTGSNLVVKIASSAATGSYACLIGKTTSVTPSTALATTQYITETGASTGDGGVVWWCTVLASTAATTQTLTPTKVSTLTGAVGTAVTLAGLTETNAMQLVKFTSASPVAKLAHSAGTTTGITLGCEAGKTPTAYATSIASTNWMLGADLTTASDASTTFYCVFKATSFTSGNAAVTSTASVQTIETSDADAHKVYLLTELTAQGAMSLHTVSSANLAMKHWSTGTTTGMTFGCQHSTSPTAVSTTYAAGYLAGTSSATADGQVTWYCIFVRSTTDVSGAKIHYRKTEMITAADATASTRFWEMDASGAHTITKTASSNLVTKLAHGGTYTGVTFSCEVAATPSASGTTSASAVNYVFGTNAATADGQVTWYCIYTRGSTDSTTMTLTATKVSTLSAADTIATGAFVGHTISGAYTIATFASSNMNLKLAISVSTGMTYGCASAKTVTADVTAAASATNYIMLTDGSLADGSVGWYCVFKRGSTDTSSATATPTKVVQPATAADTIASGAFAALTGTAGQLDVVKFTGSALTSKLEFANTITSMTFGCRTGKTPSSASWTTTAAATQYLGGNLGENGVGVVASASVVWYCVMKDGGTNVSTATGKITKTAEITAGDGLAVAIYGGAQASGQYTLMKTASSNAVAKVEFSATTGFTFDCDENDPGKAASTPAATQYVVARDGYGGTATADAAVTWFCLIKATTGTDISATTLKSTKQATLTSTNSAIATGAMASHTASGALALAKLSSSSNNIKLAISVVSGMTFGCSSVTDKMPASRNTTAASTQYLFLTNDATADGSVVWYCVFARGSTDTSAATATPTEAAVVTAADTIASGAFAGHTADGAYQLVKFTSTNKIAKVVASLTTGMSYGCGAGKTPTAVSTSVSSADYIYAPGVSTAEGSVEYHCLFKRGSTDTSAATATPTKTTQTTTWLPLTALTADNAMVLFRLTSSNAAAELLIGGTITGMTYACAEGKTPSASSLAGATASQFLYSAASSTSDASVTWHCVFKRVSTSHSDVTIGSVDHITISGSDATASTTFMQLTASAAYNVFTVSTTNAVQKFTVGGTYTSNTFGCANGATPSTTIATGTTISAATMYFQIDGSSASDGGVSMYCSFVRGSTDTRTMTVTATKVSMVSITSDFETSSALSGLSAQNALQVLKISNSNPSMRLTNTLTSGTYGCQLDTLPSAYATALASTTYHWATGSSAGDKQVTWFCTYKATSDISALKVSVNNTNTIIQAAGIQSENFYQLNALNLGDNQIVKFTSTSTTNKILFSSAPSSVTYACEAGKTPTSSTLSTLAQSIWESRANIEGKTGTLWCVFKTSTSAFDTAAATLTTVAMLKDVDEASPAFVNFYPFSLPSTTTATLFNQLMWETGTWYYQAVAAGTASPSKTQVKNFQDATSSPIAIGGRAGSCISAANVTCTVFLSNLNASTGFQVYHYIVDTFNNESPAVMMFGFSTTAATAGGGVIATYLTQAAARGASSLNVGCDGSCATLGYKVGTIICIGWADASTFECHTVTSVASLGLNTVLSYAHGTNEPVTASTSSTSSSAMFFPSVFATFAAAMMLALVF